MRHGYTNSTEHEQSAVRKTYQGPNVPVRAAAERSALEGLAGRFPVPKVLGSTASSLTMEFVPGRHGQDLVDAGLAEEVLNGCGAVLRELHSIDLHLLFPEAEGVIKHGDFGPNNVLFDAHTFAVAAVLDWEFCGPGESIEDLAWCEWIIRMHHPNAVPQLDALFTAYGWKPPWEKRRAVMVDRCRWLEHFCRAWDPDGTGVALWAQRTAATAAWTEAPQP